MTIPAHARNPRGTMRAAIYLQDAHTIREGMDFARYAEERGFEAVWQAESRLVREATVPMAAFASVTSSIKVGSGVVDCAVRALLNNERVTFSGEFVRLDGVELDYVYQARRPKDVPIYIGATGMQMMELTGEIADGVVLNYLVSPDYNLQAMEALARGAARAGRDPSSIDRPQLVVCSVHEDRRTALDMARMMVTQYLGQQPHIMKASGVPQDLLDRVGEVLTWPATHEQVAEAAKLVPDDIVQMLTASGTPDEARAQVRRYLEQGATCPILYPLGDVHTMIDTFADWDGR